MDANKFDELVVRLAGGSSRRETVMGFLAGALASAGLPALAEAKGKKGKGKNRRGRGGKGKDRKGKAQDESKKGKGQLSAEAKKKRFCLCPGTDPANCTSTNCVNCVSQGKIGKKKRDQIRNDNPLSFKGDCPDTTTTTTTTTSTTTTTPRVCGGRCEVGTNTCAQFGNRCICRGSSVIPGSDGTCTTNAGTCSGQTCTSGAVNQCAELGNNCVCNTSGPPGSQGTCGRPTTTTTTTGGPTTTTSGGPTTTTSGGPTTTTSGGPTTTPLCVPGGFPCTGLLPCCGGACTESMICP